MDNQVMGQKCEAIAEAYYLRLGFKLIERNYRAKEGEIDLVMLGGGLLLFIEVKGRSVDWEQHAWAPAWRGKLRRLRGAIRRFLHERPGLAYRQLRLEVVFVTQGRVAERFEHL